MPWVVPLGSVFHLPMERASLNSLKTQRCRTEQHLSAI